MTLFIFPLFVFLAKLGGYVSYMYCLYVFGSMGVADDTNLFEYEGAMDVLQAVLDCYIIHPACVGELSTFYGHSNNCCQCCLQQVVSLIESGFTPDLCEDCYRYILYVNSEGSSIHYSACVSCVDNLSKGLGFPEYGYDTYCGLLSFACYVGFHGLVVLMTQTGFCLP